MKLLLASKLIRPMRHLIFAALSFTSLSLLLHPHCSAAEPTFEKSGDQGTRVSTRLYKATIGSDGALTSFAPNSVEFLRAVPETIPRGVYLYQDGGLVELPEISAPSGGKVTAKGSAGSLSYKFGDASVDITASNTSGNGMIFYIVFDSSVKAVINDDGQVLKTPVDLTDQKNATLIAGKARVKVHSSDGVNLNKWEENYQLIVVELGAGDSRTVTLEGGSATPEELSKAAHASSSASTGNKQSEAADIAAVKRERDGSVSQEFLKAHASFLQRAKENPIGLLFLGDSITNRWRQDNVKYIWARFNSYEPANFGIEGDKIQHVLWRLENGEVDGVHPKIVVVLIGTNNMDYPADQIVEGVTKVVEETHQKLPNSKVLLLGIFPRGESTSDPARSKIKQINAELAKLDDRKTTRFLDCGPQMLDATGNLTPDISPDTVHLTPKGYEIWADAMLPLLSKM